MGSRNLFCVRSKSRSPSAEHFHRCIAHVGNRAHLISSCFSCHKGRKEWGRTRPSRGRCGGEKSIWKLGTHVGNGFTKSSRSQWSFPKAERKCVFIVNDTNSARHPYVFLSPILWPSKKRYFYDPKRIHFYHNFIRHCVNSLPGSLNFTRSYHNQLNW